MFCSSVLCSYREVFCSSALCSYREVFCSVLLSQWLCHILCTNLVNGEILPYIYIYSSHVKWECVRYFYPNWTTLKHIHRFQQNSAHLWKCSMWRDRMARRRQYTLFCIFFSKKHLLFHHLCEGSTFLKTVTAIFNVAPCMLPHLLYNPTHALFTL